MPILLLPLSFVVGFFEQGPMKGQDFSGILSAIYVLSAIAVIFHWVQRDAESRKKQISWILKVMLVALTIFALPFYFVKSRGWFGGAKLLAQSWMLFIAAMLCYRLGCSLA